VIRLRALSLPLLLLVAAGCASSSPAPLGRPPVPAGEDPLRWSEDMQRFAEQDERALATRGAVVFVGSSSIRLWSTLADDMAPLPVVQRGFGGSRLFDACYWSELLVSQHDPSVVVVFSGTNDIAGDAPKSAEQVDELFELFVERVRHHDPAAPICFLAITPTEARLQHVAIVRATNERIRARCERDPLLTFVDPTPDLTTADGRPDARFFRDDRLHLNADGYAVWTRHLRPVVERLYERATAR